MKVIIAGSRHLFPSVQKIQKYVDDSPFEVTELVCGMAPGVDTRAWEWAKYVAFVPIAEFPADWDGARRKFGTHKPAGFIRNRQMAAYGEALILIWDGVSSGSASMLQEASDKGLPIFQVIVKKKDEKRSKE